MTGYQVDVGELDAVLASMRACGRELAELADVVQTETRDLHERWAGLAREAHAASYGRWRSGFTEMSAALAGLHGVAEAARANYVAAVEANLAMWEQVR